MGKVPAAAGTELLAARQQQHTIELSAAGVERPVSGAVFNSQQTKIIGTAAQELAAGSSTGWQGVRRIGYGWMLYLFSHFQLNSDQTTDSLGYRYNYILLQL